MMYIQREIAMRKRQSWRGLYLLGVLGAGLLAADALAPLSQDAHDMLTVGTILLVFGLTLLWTESHADLIERSGIDARAAGKRPYRVRFISDGVNVILPEPEDDLAQDPDKKPQAPENVVHYRKSTERTDKKV